MKLSLKTLGLQPCTFELIHPTHGAVGATVTVVSVTSQKASILKDAFSIKRTRSIYDTDNETSALSEAEELYKSAREIIAACVVDWDEEFFLCECTPENVNKILQDSNNNWILQQIDDVISDIDRFFSPK